MINRKRKKTQKKILIIICATFISCLLILVIFGVGLYKYNWHNSFTDKIVRIFPYPAATVSCQIVRYSAWQDRVEQYQANKNIYLTESDIALQNLDLPDDKKIEEKALQDLIKEKILANLAKKNNIRITDEEIDKNYQEEILTKLKNGENSLDESIKKLYGLSVPEFKNQIIKNLLLRQKVSEAIKQKNNKIFEDIAQKQAEEILTKLKNGENFETLARQNNDDSTALTGGDMGYVGHGVMIDFYDQEAWSTDVGNISALIKTPDNYQPAGYYIIKVEDKRNNSGEEEIKIRHIFIEADIDKYLEQEQQNIKVVRWLKFR